MTILNIILLAISLSIDAFGIGISYSIRKVAIPFSSKIIISVISIIMTGVSFIIGSTILLFVNENVAKFTGCFMLIILGIWTIVQGLKSKNESKKEAHENKTLSFFVKPLKLTVQVIKGPTAFDMDDSKHIDIFESVYLGVSLSIDSLVVGISYAVVGGSSYLIPIYVGLAQFIFLSFGEILGSKISSIKNVDSKVFVVISGLILILLSIVRMF